MKIKLATLEKPAVKKLGQSVWTFPAILLIGVVLLTGFKVHGSSVGIYQQFFEGGTQTDEDLLFGRPRAIRSDEWLSTTPLTVSQYRNDYSVINEDLGEGHNVSLAMNLPYREWSQIFKPQNIGFFFLPLEHAFALKWWLLSFLLITAAYWLVLELFPGRKLLAILLAGALYLSPFIHWWYSDITLGPIAFALLALVALIRMHKANQLKVKLGWSAGLTYILSVFALLQYPPFQIPVAVVTGLFYIGYLLSHYNLRERQQRLDLYKTWAWVGAAVAVSGLVVLAFYLTRQEAFNALLNTVYPAGRASRSGDRTIEYLIHLFGSQFQYRLQFPGAGMRYYNNQSEVSHFIFFAPYLFIPAGYWLYRQFKEKVRQLDWLLAFSMVAIVLFFIRYFIPKTDVFFDLIFFNKSPNFRLIIGLGLAVWLFLLAFIKQLQSTDFTQLAERYLVGLTVATSFVGSIMAGIFIRQVYPNFLTTYWEIPLVATVLAAIVYLLLSKRIIMSLVLLGLFSGFSTVIINPLYQGLGTLTDTKLSKQIQTLAESEPEARWTVNENFLFEHYPLQSGAKTLNASYPYPHFELWRPLDPDGSKSDIYNRGAHVVTRFKATGETTAQVGAPNIIDILINPCSSYVEAVNLRYVLSLKPLDLKCVEKIVTITYPVNTFYIYELTQTRP